MIPCMILAPMVDSHFYLITIKQNRSRDTFYLLISFEEIKNSLRSGYRKTLYQKPNTLHMVQS